MKFKSGFYFLLSAMLICLSHPAAAETFGYTFVSASYEIFSEEIDGISEDLEGDGINLVLSLNVARNFAIVASYGTASADVTTGGATYDADVDVGGVGAIFHTPVDDKVDILAGVQLIRGSVSSRINGVTQPDEDADGNSIFAGIRAMVASSLELNGDISRTEIEDDSSTRAGIGASYYVNRLFALDADYSFNSDGNSFIFGATKYF